MPTPIIKVRGLVKHYGKVVAVDGIDFDVQHGESFALLGPNGAGKSTTIKIMTTLLPFDSGEVEINGFSVKRQPARVRESIGYVPQSVSVDGTLTGRENLSFFGKFFGLSADERQERIPKILDMLDLTEAADRPVSRYSGGMIRRLEIGQAVLHQPQVVFLDEPTVGLDPVSREILWKHIKELQRDHGMTILLTTHYMEEAEALSSRFAIMHKGKITAIGTLSQLRRRVHNPKASLEQIFIQLTGHKDLEEGDWRTVKRSRRVANRLG